MQSQIEQSVMASVAVVYGVKALVSATALKLYALVVAGYALVQLTWVHMVARNWEQVGLGGSWHFVSYAFLHTHFAVQAATIVMLAAALGLFVDAIRSLRPHPSLYSLQ